jgi:chromate transporter
MPPPAPAPSPLAEVFRLFLRLGFTAFGGPIAHIALMRDECVVRRQWISEPEFADLLGATNLIPGPNSTEMAMHLGKLRAGWPGLWVAGACFIVPAALIVSVFATVYTRFGSLPALQGVLYAVKPVVVAVVVQAIWSLAKTTMKSWGMGGLLIATFVCALLSLPEVALLFGAGLITGGTKWATLPQKIGRTLAFLIAIPVAVTAFALFLPAFATKGGTHTATPFTMTALFAFFAQVGSILYGSGYVLLAFLRETLVIRYHWLTHAQLLDATAVGQVTPGPVFTTATFIGYVLGGPTGAAVATLGIFLPSFFFVAVSGPLIPRLRQSPVAGAFLDGVNIAALALLATVCLHLGRAALLDIPTVFLALVSNVLLVRYKTNSAYLITGAALLGVVASWQGWVPQGGR